MGRAINATVEVTPQTGIAAALMLLTVPLKWVGAWLFAALCHECFHILALYLSGKNIRGISIGTFGARIRTEPLTPARSVFCALAGPFAGMLLTLLARPFPRLALCGLLQSLFNLLPVVPLDGSVALEGFLRLFCAHDRAGRICRLVETAALCLLALGCLATSVLWKLGPAPVIFALFLILRLKKRKIPCK